MTDSTDQLVAAIRARNGRVTPQRRVILRHVQRLHGHFTAERLLAEVEPDLPGVSLPTVYATLDLLEELGLVRRVVGLGGAEVYDSRPEPHHHLVCRSCGAVADLNGGGGVETADVLRSAERTGFRPDEATLVVLGTCAACARSQD
jgi:Fe2+ or Zn2+ uptake regulation protein